MEKKMFLGASSAIFKAATHLRANQTPCERKMWEFLRLKPHSRKFRRQHPIGTFILDFYCHSLNLAIEFDGEIHMDRQMREQDKNRQEYLESQGLSFLRFTNSNIENDFEKVKAKIEDYLSKHLTMKNRFERIAVNWL